MQLLAQSYYYLRLMREFCNTYCKSNIYIYVTMNENCFNSLHTT